MELEAVIEAGKFITPNFQEILDNKVITSAMITLFLIMFACIKSNRVLIFIIAFCISVTVVLFNISEEKVYEQKRNNWIENYVIPYTETIELGKKEVYDYKISYEVKTTKIDTIGKFENTLETTVMFKEGKKEKHYSGHFQIIRGDFDNMYIEYINLKNNLGNGLNEGWYNVKLYLPK